MKSILKPKLLSVIVGLLGIVACFLRGSLYALFVDGRNLLPDDHPAAIALWGLTALTAVLVVLSVLRLSGSEDERDHFSASLPAALGHILLAAGIMLTVLQHTSFMPGTIGRIWKLLGIASAPLLFYTGIVRAMGKKPFFLSYVVVSIFFAFHLVCHYRTWCSDPQLQNYVFTFTGALGLMMIAYYHGAACVGLGNRRMLMLSGLLSAYLCLASLPNSPYIYLYLGGAVWALTSLCRMEGARSRKERAGENHDSP